MGAFKKFFDDWKNSANGSSNGASGGAGQLGGNVGWMHSQLDPWPSLAGSMADGEMQNKLIMGSNGADGMLVTTAARRNMLVLGPPRSAKTAGVLIPSILSYRGPVVSPSTKDDVSRATAIA